MRNLFNIASNSLRTVTGRSIKLLSTVGCELGLIRSTDDPLDMDTRMLKRLHRQITVPEHERHRLGVLEDLLSLKSCHSYFEDNQFDTEEINAMIYDICVN